MTKGMNIMPMSHPMPFLNRSSRSTSTMICAIVPTHGITSSRSYYQGFSMIRSSVSSA